MRVEEILKNNPNLVNQTEYAYGITVLHQAVANKKTKSVRKLIEYGSDPTLGFKYGCLKEHHCALILSMLAQQDTIFKLLLNAKRLSDRENMVECLSLSISSSYEKYFDSLCEKTFWKYDNEGKLLWKSITCGKYDLAVRLLEKGTTFDDSYEFTHDCLYLRVYNLPPKTLRQYIQDDTSTIDSLQMAYRSS